MTLEIEIGDLRASSVDFSGTGMLKGEAAKL
jgi:hypothetical protein